MSYIVKEIYYTLQGEGANAGRPAVFLRFTGCNLWSGRRDGRVKGPGGCAKWCDTDFVGTDGINGGRFAYATELAAGVAALWPSQSDGSKKFVVCTGGEPLLQLDEALVGALRSRGFSVGVETNGTVVPAASVDWLTVSPKGKANLLIHKGNELKLVFPQAELDPRCFEGMSYDHFYLQPLDGPDRIANTRLAIDYCLSNPKWRLSVQTHKYIGIP